MEEFTRRFKLHLKSIGNSEAPSSNTNPADVSEGPAADNTGGSPTNTAPPSSWPHRRRNDLVPSALKTAFHHRALYATTLELCKALTDASARGGAVKTVARMQVVGETIEGVRRVRMERNEGVVSLEEQREEALRWYGKAFDEMFRDVFVEEYGLIEKGSEGVLYVRG